MYPFFEEAESITYRLGDEHELVMKTVMNRYIGENPVEAPTFRVFNEQGFCRNKDIRYEMNLDRYFPEASHGAISYIWGKLWSNTAMRRSFSISCFGPAGMYCNNELVFESTLVEETNAEVKRHVPIQLEKGWNNFVIIAQKVRSGFGVRFGTGSFKSYAIHFVVASKEREGQEGFLFTEPIEFDGKEKLFTKELLETLPQIGAMENQGKMIWRPEFEWCKNEVERNPFQRIFNKGVGVALGKTKIKSNQLSEVRLEFVHYGHIKLCLDQKVIFSDEESHGKTQSHVVIPAKEFKESKVLWLEAKKDKQAAWGLEFTQESLKKLEMPVKIQGTKTVIIYLGMMDEQTAKEKQQENHMHGLIIDQVSQKEAYWRIDGPSMVLRVYLESTNFAKWNYPLGVTLYGFLQGARKFKDTHIYDYVKEHITTAVDYYKYGVWDMQTYGATGFNNQICDIESLDDCGSFGSVTLELMKDVTIEEGQTVSCAIAEHITKVQTRLPDGALYRNNTYNAFIDETLWADDLYMSVPFLIRYFERTGEDSYLEDAILQVQLFKKYLYMPEEKIMSHIYSTRFKTKTGIPWGRGNGWVIFSLAELLSVVPSGHKAYSELVAFFRELSTGYLNLQDDEGMWHQVLTDQTSYQETSCTAMYVYAFARGVQMGLYKEPEAYYVAVNKAWSALTQYSIDRQGNVYGVCRGSGFSFSQSYYRNELPWVLNDNHGTGIVILAGYETLQMNEFLEGEVRK